MSIANTTIRLKKSLVSGNTPTTLDIGELAINAADDKLFFAKPGGTISYITNQQSFATINANSSLVLASSGTDTLTLLPGNNISISACTSTKTITINSTATGGGGSSDTSKMYNFRQNTAPITANNTGDLWTNTDTGVVYENFGNTSNPIWAEFGPTGVTNNTAPGIIASTQANISGQLFVTYTPSTTTGSAIQISAANTKGGAGYADFLQITNTSGGANKANKYIRLTSSGDLQIVNSTYQITPLSLTDAGDLTLSGNTTSNGIAPGYGPNRPSFRVYGANTTGPLSTTQNSTGQLNYNNWALDYNQGGYLNYTTGTFTAPVAGLYQINMNARNAGNASYSQLICYKNSNIVMICIEFAGSSTMNHTGGSTVTKLAAGDTLIIKVAAGTITFDGNDNWSVSYIG